MAESENTGVPFSSMPTIDRSGDVTDIVFVVLKSTGQSLENRNLTQDALQSWIKEFAYEKIKVNHENGTPGYLFSTSGTGNNITETGILRSGNGIKIEEKTGYIEISLDGETGKTTVVSNTPAITITPDSEDPNKLIIGEGAYTRIFCSERLECNNVVFEKNSTAVPAINTGSVDLMDAVLDNSSLSQDASQVEIATVSSAKRLRIGTVSNSSCKPEIASLSMVISGELADETGLTIPNWVYYCNRSNLIHKVTARLTVGNNIVTRDTTIFWDTDTNGFIIPVNLSLKNVFANSPSADIQLELIIDMEEKEYLVFSKLSVDVNIVSDKFYPPIEPTP